MLRGKITEKQQQVRNFAEVRNLAWHRIGFFNAKFNKFGFF